MNEIEKLPLESADPMKVRSDELRAIFPEIYVDGKIDLIRLSDLLGAEASSSQERFGLQWPGKSNCLNLIQQPSVGTLLPFANESLNFDKAKNLVIEGDNLEVLKLLQKSYYGSVKVIFIDPPYNTGSDFIYPDNYSEGLEDYLRFTGQVDKEGLKLSTNTESDGRFHSKWLNMMYPRLFLARNLMREDGLIFVSIDDHEVHNLRALMNEIFGEENFIANVIWQKKYTRANDAKWFSDNHDHILVFARNKEAAKLNLLPRSDEQAAAYSNPDGHPKGVWKATPLHAKSGTSREPYVFKNGIVWEPPLGTFRRFSNKTMSQMDEENEIWFGDDLLATPSRKSFLSEVKDGVTPVTIWPYEEVGHNHEANSELKELLGDGAFDNPKPTRLIRRVLELSTRKDSADLVLDFFAGSGTTGDAVIRQNAQDGGNRRFILVQLPQPSYRQGFPTIASITRKRIERSFEKFAPDENVDGFKYFRLASSCFNVWQGDGEKNADLAVSLSLFANHLNGDREQEDILHELILKVGYPLITSVEKWSLAGKTVYAVSDGNLLVCLEPELSLEVIESMVSKLPAMILCLDEGFKGNDQLKVNAIQTVKSRNRNEETDIVFKVV